MTTLALYILALIVTGLLSYRLARTAEAHKWAQLVRDVKAENRELLSVARAADDLIFLSPKSTGLELAKTEAALLTALDDWQPGRVNVYGSEVNRG